MRIATVGFNTAVPATRLQHRHTPVSHTLQVAHQDTFTARHNPRFGMLVLSRKLGEQVHIGPNITVTVVDIDRGKIRLGIDAPRDIEILRGELGKPGQKV